MAILLIQVKIKIMKIVQVINAMISNQEKITDVYRNDSEYFFLYDKKFKWSMSKGDTSENYFIHFYPNVTMNTDALAKVNNWEGIDFVSYSTDDIKTKEATESFRELYQIVADKLFGIDDIFNEIIGDSF